MLQRVALPSGETLALEAAPPAARSGLWVVFLHGLGSTRCGEKATFLEARLTTRGFGYARFDFRGHGDSDGSFETLTLSRQIEDLGAVLSHLEPDRAVLVGSSFGGLTAAWHVAIDPGPVVGQVLLAPAFDMMERVQHDLGPAAIDRWRRENHHHFVGPWLEYDLTFDVVRDAGRYLQADLPHRTRRPTLILHGTEDESVPFEASRRFAAACPEARLRPLEGAGHRLSEHKEVLLHETLGFLAER